MKFHNLGTVIAFEVRRTLLKPAFWLTTLAVPLMVAVLSAASFFSNVAAADAADARDTEPATFTYADASGIVVPEVAAALGGTPTDDPGAAAQAVRDGESDLFIDIPADPVTEGVHLVGRDIGLIDSARWDAVAGQLLRESATAQIGDPRLTGVLAGVPMSTELWVDGHPSAGWGSAIVPALFLVLLFLSLMMLGQQMLNITMEEKENRVSEMILTTIDPTVLIIGKVIGVVALGVIQGLVFSLPLLAWLLISATSGQSILPGGVDLVFDPLTLVGAVGLFLAGFLLLTGLLVAIGAIMPTAKDAGGAFGAVIIVSILPIYTLPAVISSPDTPLSIGLTLFPLTAPVTALARLAIGALPWWQGLLSFALVAAMAVLALGMGVRLFREGSIAYGQRLSLARILPGSSRR